MADAKPKTRGDARVLVVEDADAIRAAVESGLAGAGHHVLARPDGRDFERILAEFQPDLVILDVMLPAGITAAAAGCARRSRSAARARRLPVRLPTE